MGAAVQVLGVGGGSGLVCRSFASVPCCRCQLLGVKAAPLSGLQQPSCKQHPLRRRLRSLSQRLYLTACAAGLHPFPHPQEFEVEGPGPCHALALNGDPIPFETELFKGVVAVYIRHLPTTPPHLFKGKKRLAWVALQVSVGATCCCCPRTCGWLPPGHTMHSRVGGPLSLVGGRTG